MPTLLEDVGVDHATAQDLDPTRVFAEATALATANAAGNIRLGRWLGEGEEVGAEAGLALLAEERLDEVVERPLEIAEGDALVHDEALDLMELRQVRGVSHVVTVYLTRTDHVDGRLLVLHGMHLRARGLRAQEHIDSRHVRCLPRQSGRRCRRCPGWSGSDGPWAN